MLYFFERIFSCRKITIPQKTMFKKTLSFILQIFLIILLTVFTQIGGVIWLVK